MTWISKTYPGLQAWRRFYIFFMFHLSHALWCLMSIQTCQVKSWLWLCYLNTAAGFFFENKKCAHGDSAVWPCNHKPFDCRGSRNSDRLDTSIMKNSREAAIDESAHRAPTEVSWVCCCNVDTNACLLFDLANISHLAFQPEHYRNLDKLGAARSLCVSQGPTSSQPENVHVQRSIIERLRCIRLCCFYPIQLAHEML